MAMTRNWITKSNKVSIMEVDLAMARKWLMTKLNPLRENEILAPIKQKRRTLIR